MTATLQANRDRLAAALETVLLTHRDRITAGVPGCSCGAEYPPGSHAWYQRLHARHVAEQITELLLRASHPVPV